MTKDGKILMTHLKTRIKNLVLGKTKVLISDNSQLISVFILPEKEILITIDTDRMLRIWNLRNGEPEKTLMLKKMKESKKSNLEYGCISSKPPYWLAICDDHGYITVNNIFSGTVIFNLTAA